MRLLDEHGDAWTAYVSCVGADYATESGFEDARAGSADSEEELVDQYLDAAGVLADIPENLRVYFDTERYLQDMKMSGHVNFEYVNGTYYAFYDCG